MSHTDKIKSSADALQTHIKRETLRLAFMTAIFETLPDTLAAPSMANESERAFFGKPGAWLSFRVPYGSKQTASEVLGELESAGFVPLACSLVKWNDYRRAVEPVSCQDLPETKRGSFGSEYKVTGSEPVAPLWLEFNHHTGPSASAFYRGPSGHIIRANIDVAGMPARVVGHGRTYNERTGNWSGRYTSSTLQHPAGWHSLEKNGEPVANLSQHTRSYIEGHGVENQTLSGIAYWTPIVEPFDMTPSEMLSAICAKD